MKFVRLTVIPLLAMVCLSSCKSNDLGHSVNEPTTSSRAENAYLSQEQASIRSSRVSNVDYDLYFELTGEKTFTSSSVINFDLSDTQSALTLDLDEATIQELVVNGRTVKPDYNQWFITLSPETLIKGQNTVKVSFTREHSTDGEGLHRFEDPVDGKVYLYSHFEPAAAHQMFALFDQPDLKANYQMTVSAPTDWHVITAMKESRIEKDTNSNKWFFDRTLKLSPYNFSLHAGPYKVWEDNSAKYPFRLFARQSVAKQVKPEDWFKYTAQGITFFEKFYGVDYPFRKYDQVLVPDFLYGAMENAAAITFAEGSFLTNGEMSRSQRGRLASVIMHEMAHQWFGNLVTMKWWNGLWLNESFAAFMATLATAEATEFTDAWRTFYAGGKQSAYRADQRVTTHPIEVPIPSSANAFDNIDAITYSKGASVLNQLRYLLGEETFRRGIHNYLTKNAYKNAVLDDFIESLAQASNRNLDAWKKEWLYEAGVNAIAVNFQCNNNQISEFSIEQSAEVNLPTLREQRVQLALFNLKGNELVMTKVTPFTYKGKTSQVNELIGTECPDLVYPNYGDWAFVKAQLDTTSFNTAKHHLNKVSDPLLRSMLWQSLWDSVRDGKLPLNDYLDVAVSTIGQETDYTILGQVLGQINSSKAYLNKAFGTEHSYVKEVNSKLESLFWKQVNNSTDDTNNMRRWFGAYEGLASSTKALNNLLGLLNGTKEIKGLVINQDLRWSIIQQLSRFSHSVSKELIEQELTTDSSDTGIKSALFAEAISPNEQLKNTWLAKIQAEKSDLPFSKLRTVMSAMYPSEQNNLSELTAMQRIESLVDVDKAHDHAFMRSYANILIPATCTEESVERLQYAVETYTTLAAGTKRALLIKLQDDERCVMVKNTMTIQ